MPDINMFLYPVWPRVDKERWKKALSVLVSRQVVQATGEGETEGEVWFLPGKRSSHALREAPEEAFEDCRVHSGNRYFIPDGDTSDLGASCPSCGKELEDAVAVEAIVDFNEADGVDDRQACPHCENVIDVEKLRCRTKMAFAPAFISLVGAKSPRPNPDLLKALAEATGCEWDWLTEKVDL
ncbi:MAG: hypothetical protein HUU15_10000 [Candidatus Brocadiae bacterium]|nr:hypothetical protein [Candidatus Brocadiia bacterium]